ncbi:hypothetical protein CWN87_11420 [Vibrio splendidus]|nr:hypothetical protein CWN87_11420 [Vibrio splendidus]
MCDGYTHKNYYFKVKVKAKVKFQWLEIPKPVVRLRTAFMGGGSISKSHQWDSGVKKMTRKGR